MDKEHPDNRTEPGDLSSQVVGWTGKKYRSFMDYVAFRDDDPTWMLTYKLVLRFFGILFLILLSPLFILGLLIAFIAVF